MLRLIYQRAPCRRQVANRILARGATTNFPVPGSCSETGRSSRRSRRVSSCTRIVPILGRVTERGWPSPTLIDQAPLLPALLRSRKLSRQRPLRLRLGNPTLLLLILATRPCS